MSRPCSAITVDLCRGWLPRACTTMVVPAAPGRAARPRAAYAAEMPARIPLLAGEPARCLERLVIGDDSYLIDNDLVEHLRDEPDADTRHLVRSCRAAGQDGGTIEVGPPLPHLTMTTS